MQEKDGRAAAGYLVSDFGVIQTDDLHAAIISTCVRGVDACAARNWLRIGRLLSACWHLRLEQIRLFWHDNPSDQISKKPDSCHECRDQPHHTHNRDVYVEILSHAEANAGNFAALT